MKKDYKKLYEDTFEQLKEIVKHRELLLKENETIRTTNKELGNQNKIMEETILKFRRTATPTDREMQLMRELLASKERIISNAKYALSRIQYHADVNLD